MSEELKPCPFCGGAPEWASLEMDPWGKETKYYVRCFECEASRGGTSKMKEEAAEVWNTRSDASQARLSEAVKVLEEVNRLSMVIENGVKFAESHHPNIKAVMFAMSKAKAFITTLGGE